MSRTERNLLAAIGFIVTLLSIRIVAAQQPETSDDATVLILAQAMVAESDWNERDALDDHNMILHTLRRGAEQRGVSIQQHALEYVAAFDPRTHSPRATWIRSLNLEATKPDGWPQNLAWSAHVTWWVAIVDKARAFVADPSSVPDPCPYASGWAGTTDRLHGRMVPARCSRIRPGRVIANTPYRIGGRR